MTEQKFQDAIREIFQGLLARQERLPEDMERVLYDLQWYLESNDEASAVAQVTEYQPQHVGPAWAPHQPQVNLPGTIDRMRPSR